AVAVAAPGVGGPVMAWVMPPRIGPKRASPKAHQRSVLQRRSHPARGGSKCSRRPIAAVVITRPSRRFRATLGAQLGTCQLNRYSGWTERYVAQIGFRLWKGRNGTAPLPEEEAPTFRAVSPATDVTMNSERTVR